MLWEELSWPQIEQNRQEGSVVVVPCGSMEQHGRHLPVNTDSAIVFEVARGAAERVAGVLVAPLVWTGLSPHHLDFPGTISLGLETYAALIGDVCRSIARHGFRKIALVNGHGGNQALLQALALSLRHELRVHLLALSYWNLIAQEAAAIRESAPGGIAHACEMETSIQLYLHPDRVKMGEAVSHPVRPALSFLAKDLLLPGKAQLPAPFRERTPSGVMGDPTTATAEKGRRFLEAAVERLAECLREFRELDDPSSPGQVLDRP